MKPQAALAPKGGLLMLPILKYGFDECLLLLPQQGQALAAPVFFSEPTLTWLMVLSSTEASALFSET